ncbi:MAG TPA: hypothetical protein VF163_13480 [Micromonosporaceae bacterium]
MTERTNPKPNWKKVTDVRSTTAQRWCVGPLVAVLAGLVAVAGVSGPAAAEPGEDTGSESLREQLADAARGYLDAKTKLDQSRQRQRQLQTQLTTVQSQLATRNDAVGELAAAAYRTGPFAAASTLLTSDSPETLIDRFTLLEAVAAGENKQVRELTETRAAITQTKAAVDAQVREQQKQLGVMAQRKRQAEKALAQVGGAVSAGFSGSGGSAAPAPRNPDGSWPPESCSVNDPTTSGCITPRTLHALNQAKAAGFTRYVSCYRSGTSGEHPKGRACDFAAQVGGFGGTATGGDRTYGNNLAAYFVRNASNLGVLYVIWYRQIWMASTGWRTYYGSGTPSSDHTNHVHLSVY